MKIKDFKLERYFAIHEFTAKYLLSSSDCDGYALSYVLDQASKEELALYENIKLGYTDSQGDPLLRESILQYYNTKAIENVVVASPGELNFITMNVLLKPSDHVIAVAPCYQSLTEVVKSLGCELSYWKPNEENWEFDPKDLEPLIQKNTKLIILNFPHNPTGSYLTIDQLHEIIKLADENNLHIFSDEMYHKLLRDTTKELPPISDLYDKGISLWGTSKTFGLAGLRLGWLVSQDTNFLKQVIAFKDYLSICSSAPSEILTLIALNKIDAFLVPNLKKINANIARFKIFTERHKIIESFLPPKSGSTAFVKLNIQQSAKNFSDQLVKETGIMTIPAEMFGHEGKYIRVGFGRENLAEVLEVFSAYLEEKEEAVYLQK